MFITVQFKDKEKNFKGKKYDFKLAKNEALPRSGDIIRMYNEDGGKCCNGTRVKVVDVKVYSRTADLRNPIRYEEASLED